MHRSKYRAVKKEVDGITFDSSREARRYAELKLLERAGVIEDLILQPRYTLQESFRKGGKNYRKIEYVADFQYLVEGEKVVEDVKGYKTDVYKLKKKLFEYRYPELTIKEV